ncbi:MAG TPA: transcription elongation factor GreA [Candidatus Saccharimonadales bacterium]|nr:transcription elongation factor GreA [Candidatus Saccharimonadales bacterium]
MKKLFHLTEEGVAELKAELENLINSRADVAERIKTAREFGDLSENAEYQVARQEQEKNEARIAELEHIIANVDIIKSTGSAGKVRLGSKVTLEGQGGKKKEFQIVGTVEADPLEGKISDESPIGQALMGKKVGEEVEIKTPAETTTYKIVSIG